jgi:hypothetical protein
MLQREDGRGWSGPAPDARGAVEGEEQRMLEIWDLWFPDAGATGIPFARSCIDDQAAGDRLLVHAAPPKLDVAVLTRTAS